MKKFLFPLLLVAVVIAGVGIVRYQKEKQAAQESTTLGSVPSEVTPGADLPVAQQQANVRVVAEIILTITSPLDGATVTSASITVKGKTVARAEVFVNDKEIKADGNGNFSVTLTLDEGENPIVVFANDANGNVAEKDLTVTYNSGQ